MLEVFFESKSRGYFIGYVQALNYHKNTNGFISVKIFGLNGSMVSDTEYSDVIALTINGEQKYPEDI